MKLYQMIFVFDCNDIKKQNKNQFDQILKISQYFTECHWFKALIKKHIKKF